MDLENILNKTNKELETIRQNLKKILFDLQPRITSSFIDNISLGKSGSVKYFGKTQKNDNNNYVIYVHDKTNIQLIVNNLINMSFFSKVIRENDKIFLKVKPLSISDLKNIEKLRNTKVQETIKNLRSVRKKYKDQILKLIKTYPKDDIKKCESELDSIIKNTEIKILKESKS